MDVYLQLHVGEVPPYSLHRAAHLRGVGNADGVRQVHRVHAAAADAFHKMQHLIQRGYALKWATEGGGHADAQLQLREALPDAAQLLKGLVMGSVDVGLVVGLADGDDIGQVLQPRRPGQLRPLEVGNKRHQFFVWILLHAVVGHLPGVHHLRDGLRADEGGDLNTLQSAGKQPVDVLQLLLRGQHPFEVLPAISRSALKDLYFLHFLCASYVFNRC